MNESTIDQGSTGGSIGGLVDKDDIKQLGTSFKDRFVHTADSRIEGIVKEIEQIGEKLGEREGDEPAPVAEFISSMAKNVSGSLHDMKTEDLIRLGREQIQKRPGLVFAGLLGIGFLGARMLKR